MLVTSSKFNDAIEIFFQVRQIVKKEAEEEETSEEEIPEEIKPEVEEPPPKPLVKTVKLLQGPISPNFVYQAKRRRRTAFGEKFAVQFHQ